MPPDLPSECPIRLLGFESVDILRLLRLIAFSLVLWRMPWISSRSD